jgi:cellulose biosynthesis protein BcsQ
MNARMNNAIRIAGIFANKVINNPIPQSVKYYLTQMRDDFQEHMLNTEIHQTVKISDAIALQEKVSAYATPKSKAAQQIASLTNEIIHRMEK